jgi:acetylornithine deacetylase/succinyl-diaminopimelate desuccinylase-like protein
MKSIQKLFCTSLILAGVLALNGCTQPQGKQTADSNEVSAKSKTHTHLKHNDCIQEQLVEGKVAAKDTATLNVNHASDEQLKAYDNFFKENKERHLNELMELVTIQSLAMDSAHLPDVLKAAEFVKKKLETIGMQNVTIHTTEGYYTLTAEWMNAPGQPTALFYGHMDVQPVTPKLWDTDPWKPEIKDGRMYGRGATDDKGPVLALISALEAILKLDGKLPANVMLALDGSEEFGSATWPEWLAKPEMKSWITKPDYGFNADAAIQNDSTGLIWKSFRGFTDVDVTLTSANRALHSGGFGGAVPNSAIAAAKVISSMYNDDGSVAIEGWYDDQTDMPKEVHEEIAGMATQEGYDEFRKKYDVPEFIGEKAYTPLERTWIRGSLDVTGVKSGYTEGAASIIPETSWFRVMARLGPGMTAEKTHKLIMDHVTKHVPWGIKVDMKNVQNCDPVWIDTSDRGLQISKTVQTEFFGNPTKIMYVGGSVGPASFISMAGGPKLVSFGFQQTDENFHTNNEFMRISSFEKAQRAYTRLLHALVGQPLKKQ